MGLFAAFAILLSLAFSGCISLGPIMPQPDASALQQGQVLVPADSAIASKGFFICAKNGDFGGESFMMAGGEAIAMDSFLMPDSQFANASSPLGMADAGSLQDDAQNALPSPAPGMVNASPPPFPSGFAGYLCFNLSISEGMALQGKNASALAQAVQGALLGFEASFRNSSPNLGKYSENLQKIQALSIARNATSSAGTAPK